MPGCPCSPQHHSSHPDSRFSRGLIFPSDQRGRGTAVQPPAMSRHSCRADAALELARPSQASVTAEKCCSGKFLGSLWGHPGPLLFTSHPGGWKLSPPPARLSGRELGAKGRQAGEGCLSRCSAGGCGPESEGAWGREQPGVLRRCARAPNGREAAPWGQQVAGVRHLQEVPVVARHGGRQQREAEQRPRAAARSSAPQPRHAVGVPGPEPTGRM